MNHWHIPLLAFIILVPSLSHARKPPLLSYEQLAKKADFILVVRAIRTRDAHDGDPIVEMKRGEKYLTPVITHIRVLATLKGKIDSKEIHLPHYRVDHVKAKENGLNGWGNGPALVQFPESANDVADSPEPRAGDRLLFLIKDDGGKFDFVTGQFDPKYSVFPLSP